MTNDDLVDEILSGVPESWDGDDGAESIAINYVRTIEARLIALGGSTERYPEDGDGAPLPDALADPDGFARATRGA
jgi:hypothetical protein